MDLAEENQDVNTLQLPSVRHGSQWRKKARALAWTCCLLWTVESPRLRHAGRGGLFTLPVHTRTPELRHADGADENQDAKASQ